MTEKTKNFLNEAFYEIQNSLYSGDYEDAACDYCLKDGVLEIAIGRDFMYPIEEEVRYILSNKLLSLFGDDFEGEVDENDYFDIDLDEDGVDVGRCFNLYIGVYYITVEANIEKLEELFNEIS